MTNRIDRQNAEFDSLTDLCKNWSTLRKVAVVEDDYCQYRNLYEIALKRFLRAVVANRGALR